MPRNETSRTGSCPPQVVKLVERFDLHKDTYKLQTYNETQVRREFIDPFFKALGWDVDNTAGHAEMYKDVIHEDAIKIGGFTKAPDYCFRIGGTRKFFVEAKKPAVDIEGDANPAYQLRRYAWTGKLPLSIVTDFEELAVYDCRIKPKKNDKPSTARVFYCTYDQYGDKWGEIASIFSKDAILKGSFDKYAESNKRKKGTAEVDSEFLKEIESWREALAKNIALRNKQLSVRELNYAVGKIIDRILFLRISEDRGIETYAQLQALLNSDHVYRMLVDIFYRADERYNSGLFHFTEEKERPDAPDELTPELTIDDTVLKDIIRGLYYPDCPYEFSVLSGDILGQVYEQFLGKVIRLTKGHRAVVEEKPEVKKAGGVYYTPTYIVDYIVEHTVGKLLEKAGTPQKVATLRILDPACGSGSFLIGAYRCLLNWHLVHYINDDPRKHAKKKKAPIYEGPSGDWQLTVGEKKRILLNNIYGVDIDSQAVEVTKLSLLLKVLEGESQQTIVTQLKLFHERALPDLAENIKCGNSLIGPDVYENQQLDLLDEEERYRINIFDWNTEFAGIMKSGGFNAVIGNPPWVSLSGKFRNDICSSLELQYLIARYRGNTYMPNIYEYFVAQGLNLATEGGYFSFIVPDRLGFNRQFILLRKRILEETFLLSLVYKAPFPGITAYTVIFVLRKGKPKAGHCTYICEYEKEPISVPQNEIVKTPNHSFEYFETVALRSLVTRIEKSSTTASLSSFCDTTSGFGGKSKLITTTRFGEEQIPVMKGDSIQRYTTRRTYWFTFRKKNITGRTTNQQKLGAVPKVLLRKTGASIISTFDESGTFPEQSLYFLYDFRKPISPLYLLGMLNSAFMTCYYQARSVTNIRSIAQVKKVDLDRLPIRTIDFAKPAEKSATTAWLSLFIACSTYTRNSV